MSGALLQRLGRGTLHAAALASSLCFAGGGYAAERLPAATADELQARFDEAPRSPTLADDFNTLQEGRAPDEILRDDAANFDQWQPLLDDDASCMQWEEPYWRPMDRLRQWGFRHSSTEGRHVGRGLPLERSSWMNRPLHVDWFVGPLLGADLAANVHQENVTLAGVRLGWDIDYFWGLDWRFGWAGPQLDQSLTPDEVFGQYFVSDFDVVYYPWGDSKVRPYFIGGLGLARIGTVRADGNTDDAVLLGMPFGVGIRFLQTPWLAWRLEFLNNFAFGASDINTVDNVSFTAGMEIRLGAKPGSYWPWRSSRTMW